MQWLILEAFLPYRLNRVGVLISQSLKKVYGRKYGLTIPEWRVLATLGQFGRLTAKAIGTHSSMHKTKVSRAVSALEKRRWLTRIKNPDDRREEWLMLTSAGQRAYKGILPEIVKFESAFIETLGKANVVAVYTALTELERALGIPTQSKSAAKQAPKS